MLSAARENVSFEKYFLPFAAHRKINQIKQAIPRANRLGVAVISLATLDKGWRFQINMYGNVAQTEEEERYYLWFDPFEEFHRCSILWTPNKILSRGEHGWKAIDIIIGKAITIIFWSQA